jgi:hypothetical protein
MGYSAFETTFNEEVYAFRPPLTVILDKPWNEQSTACQEALHKLLEKVQQSLESVRLVHQSTLDLSVWGADPPARIVAFVNPPKGIAMNEKISTPTSEIVVTEPLSVLLSNDEVKRKFWSAFKTLFPS